MKNAPKTITSEMMKSSIPSSGGSTRELLVRRRRAVVLVLVVPVAWAMLAASIVALAMRPEPRSWWSCRSTTTCSTSAEVAWRTRSIRFERSQPERSSGSVEMTTSSTVNSSSALIAAV